MGSFNKASLSLVALPKQIGSMPVANGSRVPMYPAFLALYKRFTICKARLELMPAGLSKINKPLIFNFSGLACMADIMLG